MSIDELLHQAESDAWRPQAVLQRFFELSRPIGDASRGGEALRLHDAAAFFSLFESLRHLGCAELNETLLIVLDDFAQLEPRSYDELYLWCIVELSRSDIRYVEQFWPMVLALDVRYRGAAWQRPKEVSLIEQPYRLIELVFYYYVLYTLPLERGGNCTVPLLARCVERILDRLSSSQRELMQQTLRDLAKATRHGDDEDRRHSTEISDASGLLQKYRARPAPLALPQGSVNNERAG